MAFNLNKNNYNKRARRQSLACEINVTPLVDVMLVLLIIFMVTSPMLVSGINVDLPESKPMPISGQDEPLVVSIDKTGDIYLFDTKILKENLIRKLTEITKEKKDSRIFVKGDKNLSYGKIVEVISTIYASGFHKVALISNTAYNEK